MKIVPLFYAPSQICCKENIKTLPIHSPAS
jgi:hypothetical protein